MTDQTRALLELLARTPLNKREGQVFGAVALLTIGDDQKERELSSQQLADATGIDARHVRKTLAALETRGVIRQEGRTKGRAATISLLLPATESAQPAPTRAQERQPEATHRNQPAAGNHEARAPSKTRARDLNPRLLEAAEGHARSLRIRDEQLSEDEVRADLVKWYGDELPADEIDCLVEVWRKCPHRGLVSVPRKRPLEITSL
jgi:phage replication O-like protein O